MLPSAVDYCLEDADPSIIYAMFKGEPGTRKSTHALSFPPPQFWFSWDMKMQALRYPAKLWKIDLKKDVKYQDYTDWDKAKRKLESLREDCPYSTLIFDSVTSGADMTLKQTLGAKIGIDRKSGQAAGKFIAGIAVNEMEDYNAESSALNDLIFMTKDIQQYNYKRGKIVNIILIAHVMEVTKPNQGVTHISRTIVTAGKRVAAKLPAYCSEVYHFNIDMSSAIDTSQEGKYTIITEHTGEDFARTSLGLPKKIELGNDPLYSKHIAPAIKRMKELQVGFEV